MAKILIVEDEVKIATLLQDYLQASGHDTQLVHDGTTALDCFNSYQPDLVLLDLMLPGRDGTEICRDIRQHSQVGIIMVTAKVEEVDRLLGLEIGADDYICKPFSPKEVVARVQALLRRLPQTSDDLPINLDENGFSVEVKGQPLETTPTEFRLLAILFKHPGQIYSRSQLVDRLHEDFRDISDRAVDSHIKNLRKKLKQVLPDLDIIKSVYGVGYKAEID